MKGRLKGYERARESLEIAIGRETDTEKLEKLKSSLRIAESNIDRTWKTIIGREKIRLFTLDIENVLNAEVVDHYKRTVSKPKGEIFIIEGDVIGGYWMLKEFEKGASRG